MRETILRAVAAALDGLDVGFCAFDTDDCTLAWNETFLDFFPEHRGAVHVGEHYADNLLRFYLARLKTDELPQIQRYIEEGVKRHRLQRRPYEFDHRGVRVRVSSVDMGPFGRLRVWRKVGDAASANVAPVGAPRAPVWTPQPPDAAKVLERLPDGVLIVDPADQALWANEAFLKLYGLVSLGQARGQPFEAIVRHAWGAEADSALCRTTLETLREHQRFSGAPFELPLPGNRWVRIIEQRSTEADGLGSFVHVDITVLKRQQQALHETQARLEALATQDSLTGLANRRRFDEALDLEVRRAQREGSELALLVIDLDDFKAINDTLGHPVGDDVLRRVARVIGNVAQRAGDLAARYGGEEFAVLLPGTSVAQAEVIAERLRLDLAALDLRFLGVAALTASVGLATSTNGRGSGTAADLVFLADEALYAAKRAGKDRVQIARGADAAFPAAPASLEAWATGTRH